MGLSVRLALAAGVMLAGSSAVNAAEGHPDLSGTWATPFRVHSSGVPMATDSTPWVPVSAGDVHAYPILTLDELSAIADRSVAEHHGVPIYGRPPPPPLPLNAAGKAAVAAIDPKSMVSRELACYPTNVVERAAGSPIRIVQNTKALAILAEAGAPGRTIFTDGRQPEIIAQWNGISTGVWVGKTLKVTTVGIRGDNFGFNSRNPMDEEARLTEEFTLLPGGNALDVLITFEDPTYYTEPLKRLVHYKRAEDVMVTDYQCTEGKDESAENSIKAVDFEARGPAPAGAPGAKQPGDK